MIKKRLCVPTLLLLTVFEPAAHAVQLNGLLTIDAGIKANTEVSPGVYANVYQGGSYFAMNSNNPNGNSVAMLSPGTAGGIQLNTFQNFVTDPDVPHPQGWKGDINGDGIPDGAAGGEYNALVSEGSAFSSFKFFGVDTFIGLNPVSYQSGLSKNAPTLDLVSGSCVNNICNIAVDLSAWEVYWNGSVFEQGPRPDNSNPSFDLAMGTIDTVTGRYTLDWSSQILGGAFNGVMGFWHLEGQLTSISAVPVPAAIWLFGSGLIMLFGWSRKKVK